MKTARLIAQTWIAAPSSVAMIVGTAASNSLALLAISLNEKPKPRPRREPKPPYEGTWAERVFGIDRD